MAKYIDKATVVAEIKRIRTLVGDGKLLSEYESGCRDTTLDICDDILSFLDTLEPKKVVELDKVCEWLEKHTIDYRVYIISEECEGLNIIDMVRDLRKAMGDETQQKLRRHKGKHCQ